VLKIVNAEGPAGFAFTLEGEDLPASLAPVALLPAHLRDRGLGQRFAREFGALHSPTFARLDHASDTAGPLAENEVYLRYRVRAGRLKFASDAYFFQEGTAETYGSARYGRYRVADDGELLLTSLHDENLVQLPAAGQ